MPADAFVQELCRTLPEAVEQGDGGVALLPRSTSDVITMVRLACSAGARLTPPGAEPRDGALVVDLQRMNEVIAVDDTSHLVHAQAGITVGALEAALRPRGLTLGLLGPPPEVALGRWLALGAPGARDHANDPVDQLVAGLEAVLADGRPLTVRPAPRRAVGPDLVGALVGGRSRIGIVTAAHVVARRRLRSWELTFLFGAHEAAQATRAWVRGRGVRPAAAHVVDAPEGAALRLRIEGEGELGDARARVARAVAQDWGGVEVPPDEAPALARPVPPPPSRVVATLAEALDPRGVLG